MLRIDFHCKLARTKALCKQKPRRSSQSTSVSNKSTSIEINHGSGTVAPATQLVSHTILFYCYCFVLLSPLLSAQVRYLRVERSVVLLMLLLFSLFFYRIKNVWYSPIVVFRAMLDGLKLRKHFTDCVYACVFCWFSVCQALFLSIDTTTSVEQKKKSAKRKFQINSEYEWAIVMRLYVMTLKQENGVIERLLRLTINKRNTIKMV